MIRLTSAQAAYEHNVAGLKRDLHERGVPVTLNVRCARTHGCRLSWQHPGQCTPAYGDGGGTP